MENCCWNCASPDHHKRECDQDPNPEIKRLVQEPFRTTSAGSERAKRLTNIWLQNLERRSDPANLSTPFYSVKAVVDRLTQFLYEKGREVAELESVPIPVSADLIQQKLDKVNSLIRGLDKERENIRQVGDYRTLYNNPRLHELSEDRILGCGLLDVHHSNVDITRRASVLRTRLMSALTVIQSFNEKSEQLTAFLQMARNAYEESLLEITNVNHSWGEQKRTLTSLSDLQRKYGYLFDPPERAELTRQIDELSAQWAVVKKLKHDYESGIPKVQCKLCLERDVEFVLLNCGHVLCGVCLEAILRDATSPPECATCTTEINNGILKLNF